MAAAYILSLLNLPKKINSVSIDYFFEEVPLQIATKIVARDFFPEILTDTL